MVCKDETEGTCSTSRERLEISAFSCAIVSAEPKVKRLTLQI